VEPAPEGEPVAAEPTTVVEDAAPAIEAPAEEAAPAEDPAVADPAEAPAEA
jgi:hypothetical protein